MVFYFTSNAVSPSAFIYVGKDKFENEDLIKYGLDSDFHVDNLSSAHIYLRLRKGETWDNIPEALLKDCAQLTKANSIEGNKKDNVTIIYTPWSNLRKTGDMATGQVSFHNNKLVKKVLVETRENPIVNRLNKTKVEKYPDFAAEKEEYLAQLRREDRKKREEYRNEEKRLKKEYEDLKWQKEHAYDSFMGEDMINQSSNENRSADWEEDFM